MAPIGLSCSPQEGHRSASTSLDSREELGPRRSKGDALGASLTGASRWVTLGLGLFALSFALTESRVIFFFVLFAWAGIGSAFCPVIILSLFWKRFTRAGAIAAMITGFFVTIVWKLAPPAWLGLSGFIEAPAPPDKPLDQLVAADLVYEMVPAFVFATLAAVLVSLFTAPPANAAADLDATAAEVVDLWS